MTIHVVMDFNQVRDMCKVKKANFCYENLQVPIGDIFDCDLVTPICNIINCPMVVKREHTKDAEDQL